MCSFTCLLLAAALATAAYACNDEPTTTITATATPTATSVSQCNVSGGAQCCQSTATVSLPHAPRAVSFCIFAHTHPLFLLGGICSRRGGTRARRRGSAGSRAAHRHRLQPARRWPSLHFRPCLLQRERYRELRYPLQREGGSETDLALLQGDLISIGCVNLVL